MFCTNCGKQIEDTAKFCNYCGKANTMALNTQEPEACNTPITPEPANDEQAEQINVATTPILTQEDISPVVLQPVEQVKEGTAGVSTDNQLTNPTITVEKSEKSNNKPRMYTSLHITMCLIATAVMAIVAGVFAGLYFSVV